MVLVKLGLPKEENIVTRNKFIVNKIVPIAIRETNIENQFIILFAASQDYDDSYVFLQILVNTENELDLEYLKNHNLNIFRFKDKKVYNENNKEFASYLQIISKMTSSNVYGTDLRMEESKDHPFYYHCVAVRAIDKSHASLLDLYFTTDNFVKTNIYLNRIISIPFNKYIHEEIFQNKKFNNVEMVGVETVKIDGTKTVNHLTVSYYTTHYTMNCGPSKYVFNWLTVGSDKNILKNPLDSSLYDSFYKDHFDAKESFLDNKYCYLIYEEKSPIDGSFKKIKVLRLKPELVEKTNIVDYENIFLRGE